jgi:predicted dehydrogenase
MPDLGGVRLGILGCGARARVYLERLASLGLRPRAYADPVESAARAALDRFGGEYATGDPGRVLRDDGIDAVLIATRHDSHAPLALAAAAAGKAILLEKPLALRLEECAAVTEAVERAGVPCLLGHKLRHAPLFRRLVAEFPRPLLTVVQVFDHRWPDGSWVTDPVQGGGNVLSQGCHGADLALALHCSRPVHVVAAGGALTHPGAPAPDVLALAVTFAEGAVSVLTVADAGEPGPAVGKFFFQACDGRRAGVLRERCRVLEIGAASIRAPADEDPEGDTQLLEEFLACAAAARPPEVAATARDGWRAMRLLHAGWQALRSGGAVSLPDWP